MIRLSMQERKVAREVLAGAGDALVAVRLSLSVWTVRTYLRRIADRLDPNGRPRLVLERHRSTLELALAE